MARASYGVDAPGALVGLGAGGLVLLGIAVANDILDASGLWGWLGPALGAAWLLGNAGLYLYTTLRGKFAVWNTLLDGLALRGDERVLDLGCGRGAVLLAAAARLPTGWAIGVDLWRSVDQSGNAPEVTERNAAAEGVADRVELHTGDMTALPFPPASFDVVLSSLAIHNIPRADGRRQAVDEAARVLRSGGRLLLVDIQHATAYQQRLESLGMAAVARRGLGWRFWYGGPWMAASAVTAAKPESG